MRLAVIGGGALGLIYAALATRSHEIELPIHIVSRQAELARLAEAEGVDVQLAGAEATELRLDRHALRVIPPGQPSPTAGAADIVLLLSRSYESAYAAAEAARLVAPAGWIVTLQNGLSGWDELRKLGRNYLAAAAYTGGRRTAPNSAVQTAAGRVVVSGGADKKEPAERLAAFLRGCGIAAEIGGAEPDVIWRKLLLIPINWACASLGAATQDLIRSEASRPLFLDSMRELIPIAAVDGALVDWREILGDFDLWYRTAAPHGVGSAYSALVAGQRLEVEDICRSVLERAGRAGVATPITSLYARLLDIQSIVFPLERARWKQAARHAQA